MTDEQVLEGLKKADHLLAQYRAQVEPIAAELAKKKSIFVFGNESSYSGDLGCFESGINSVCLHIVAGARGPDYKDYQRRAEDRAYDFENTWNIRLMEAGIKHVSVIGHF